MKNVAFHWPGMLKMHFTWVKFPILISHLKHDLQNKRISGDSGDE